MWGGAGLSLGNKFCMLWRAEHTSPLGPRRSLFCNVRHRLCFGLSFSEGLSEGVGRGSLELDLEPRLALILILLSPPLECWNDSHDCYEGLGLEPRALDLLSKYSPNWTMFPHHCSPILNNLYFPSHKLSLYRRTGVINS